MAITTSLEATNRSDGNPDVGNAPSFRHDAALR
jgi:hypothetical protein